MEPDNSLQWVDTHAHLFDDAFREDLDETVARASARGVTRIVLPNIDAATVTPLLATLGVHPDTFRGAMGLHPTSVGSDWRGALESIRPSLDAEGVVAVGEVGLDFYWDTASAPAQRDALQAQMEWALERDWPVLLHARNAIDDVLTLLEAPRLRSLRAVLHAFNGSEAQYRRAMARPNTWIGLGGIATYKNGFTPELMASLDFGRAVMETDCPYLAPVPHRGKRNEPAFLVDTASSLVSATGCPLERIARLTTQAAADLFKW